MKSLTGITAYKGEVTDEKYNLCWNGCPYHNYTLSCYTLENDVSFATIQVEPDYKNILKYLEKVQKNYGEPCEFLCGYEADCLGFTLYEQMKNCNINCVILAPTSIPSKKNEIQTNKRDAEKIARCLAYNTYSAVHIPTKQDSDVKEKEPRHGALTHRAVTKQVAMPSAQTAQVPS